MRFALVNNARLEAEPKMKAQCPGCSQPVIAKCGKQRIRHWAHVGERSCDRWWEPETEWHRGWKDKFEPDWQEYLQYDTSGEKHIADVRTEHGLVIEFQHSHLDPLERAARERFYGNMVWVVDGTRLKKDYPRFVKGRMNLSPTVVKGFYLVPFPDECFPSAWLGSAVPVVFDFRGTAPTDRYDIARDALWCLLPGRAEGNAVVAAMSRIEFLSVVSSRSHLLPVHELVSTFALHIRQQRASSEPLRRYRHWIRRPGGRQRWRGRL